MFVNTVWRPARGCSETRFCPIAQEKNRPGAFPGILGFSEHIELEFGIDSAS
jgi:hypothetical protein